MLDFDGTRRARRRDAAIAGIILLMALLLLGIGPNYQRPVRQAVRSTVLRPFLAAQSQIVQRRGRMVDVTSLRAQRDSLAAVVAAQASLSEENRQLRAALGLSARLGDSFVNANVLRAGLSSAESTFILDVGSEHGVQVGSPVITADGLLGVVVEVDGRSAQAIDWTHGDFRVSAMTADGAAYGIVEPRRREHREEDLLALTGSPFQVDVRPGRRVHTSGRGNLFPRGVLVGTVIGIEEADTGWRKSYLIQPAVRPEAATHVLVGVAGTGGQELGALWNMSAPPDTTRVDSGARGGR
ncbi:MAG TPA: rod shape-determining protein MreC [Longimicrobiales bacterium]|nr:rod shape-determining protein MreC [Longimicrobiales bacterium]